MSPVLPVIKPKELLRALKKIGYVEKHQKGSHIVLYNPERPGKIVTLPFHNKDLKKGTLKSILKQAALEIEDLQKYL